MMFLLRSSLKQILCILLISWRNTTDMRQLAHIICENYYSKWSTLRYRLCWRFLLIFWINIQWTISVILKCLNLYYLELRVLFWVMTICLKDSMRLSCVPSNFVISFKHKFLWIERLFIWTIKSKRLILFHFCQRTVKASLSSPMAKNISFV